MKFEKISKQQYIRDGVDAFIDYDDIKLPRRATKKSAGYDIYSVTDFTLDPGGTIKLPTGIKIELDDDKMLLIAPRSGQGFKYKLQLYNTVGVIDADFYNNTSNEGHVWVKLYNDSPDNKSLIIKKGDAICQGIITQFFKVEDDESNGGREGGFGSTSNSVDELTFEEFYNDRFHNYFEFMKLTNGILYKELENGQIYTLEILTPDDLNEFFTYKIQSINNSDVNDLMQIILKVN